MKTIRFSLLLIIMCLCNTINTQAQKDSIFWGNGDVTFLSDLDNVWIILKKGSDLKNVRIREIKKQKGTLVYEKEKCLHDVLIGNIKKIQPGKNPLSFLYFYADNTPYIKKQFIQMDALTSYSDFKSTKIPVQEPEKKEEPKMALSATPQYSSTANNIVNNVCDTIIDGSGFIILAKILEINDRVIRYKNMKNFNGPIYIKSSKDAHVLKYSECITVSFLTK